MPPSPPSLPLCWDRIQTKCSNYWKFIAYTSSFQHSNFFPVSLETTLKKIECLQPFLFFTICNHWYERTVYSSTQCRVLSFQESGRFYWIDGGESKRHVPLGEFHRKNQSEIIKPESALWRNFHKATLSLMKVAGKSFWRIRRSSPAAGSYLQPCNTTLVCTLMTWDDITDIFVTDTHYNPWFAYIFVQHGPKHSMTVKVISGKIGAKINQFFFLSLF